MAISRMQNPRQMYGLGSLVKSIKKGVKTGIKGVTKTIKKNPLLSLAALNFAPMMFSGGAPFIGMGGLKGTAGTIPALSSLFSGGAAAGGATKAAGGATLGKTLGVAAGGTLLGTLLASAEEGDEEAVAATRNVGSLRSYLFDGYKNLGYTDGQAQELTDKDTTEYTFQQQNNFASGGRVAYGLGSLVSASMQAGDTPNIKNSGGMSQMLSKLFNNPQLYASLNKSDNFIDENFNGIDDRQEAAYGGRIGFARGPDNPEQNAMQAAGIMDLPLNQNPAGVTELDLRETGGFIPPVGVKEKADDIPAMLANNEFVFTADAVRGMGDGNVNKGAQRMYDMMKKLEKGGRV